jgi:hypothetical protein
LRLTRGSSTAKLAAIDPPKVRLCALVSGVKKRLKPPSQGRVPDKFWLVQNSGGGGEPSSNRSSRVKIGPDGLRLIFN